MIISTDCGLSSNSPPTPLYAGLWRDPGERRCSADSAAAEESQSQRLCRAVRQVDQRGVSHTRGPARRGASASSRLRVHRTLPSREKPPGTRQPAPATTTTSAKAGRRRSAAGTPRRITQFLQSRGRMRGRPIKRTLRPGRRQILNVQAADEISGRHRAVGVRRRLRTSATTRPRDSISCRYSFG